MRLFTAIQLPPTVCKFIERFTGGSREVHWVDPLDYHITLSFHESIAQEEMTALELCLESITFQPFDLELKGVGIFPTGSGAVLFAAVTETESLVALADSIRTLLKSEGFTVDSKKFVPHITIGRAKSLSAIDLHGFLEQGTLCTGSHFTVDHFSLFQSELSSEKAIYTELERFDALI